MAQVLNDKFMPYYDTFVVAAMKLVDQLTAQTAASTSHADILDTIMLRNVTMETIAIIGEAVGRVCGMRVGCGEQQEPVVMTSRLHRLHHHLQEKFAADGIRLLEGMLKLMVHSPCIAPHTHTCTKRCSFRTLGCPLQNNKVDDDTTSGYLVKSVCRISKVLGEAFEPYLPRVIPALVQQAALKVCSSAHAWGEELPAATPDSFLRVGRSRWSLH